MKKFKFTIGGSNYSVNVKGIENNIAEIEVNGTPYDIEIEQEIKTSKTPVVLVRKEVKTKHGDERMRENLHPVSEEKRRVPKPSNHRFRNILKVNVNAGTVLKTETY